VYGMRPCGSKQLGTSCPPNHLSDYGWIWAAYLKVLQCKTDGLRGMLMAAFFIKGGFSTGYVVQRVVSGHILYRGVSSMKFAA